MAQICKSRTATGNWLRFQPRLCVWEACWCLCAPTARRGGPSPTVNMQRMRLLGRGPCPSLCMHVKNATSMQDLGSILCTSLVVAWTTLRSLQTLSTQPTPVLSPGPYAEAQVSAPTPQCTPADVCFGLGSAARWLGLSVLVSLCSACRKPAAALSSEPLKLPICPG